MWNSSKTDLQGDFAHSKNGTSCHETLSITSLA